MDHKKVNGFAAYDENAALIVDGLGDPISFMAEFCEGNFGGDVSSSTGTFSGSLTVNAIDAIGNVNIRGQAVAVSTYSTRARAPNSGYFSHTYASDVYSSVISHTVDVPAEDVNGGVVLFTLAWTSHSDLINANEYHRIEIEQDGVNLWTSGYYHHGCLKVIPDPFSVQAIFDVLPGAANNFEVFVVIPKNLFLSNSDMRVYVKDAYLLTEYIRK